MDDTDHGSELISLLHCIILYKNPAQAITLVKKSQSLWDFITIPL